MLDSVFKELERHSHDVWEKVGELVCKTVSAVFPQLVDGRSYMFSVFAEKTSQCFSGKSIE